MLQQDDLETIQIHTSNLFEAAVQLNSRTRHWDETDCFFWMRWAKSLGEQQPVLPISRFAEELDQAGESLLALTANRRLSLRQAVLILRAPKRYREFLEQFLSESIRLNANETAEFIDMLCDLTRTFKKPLPRDLFAELNLLSTVEQPRLSPGRKGEALLKEMRILRYPYYQKKAGEFSSEWHELSLDEIVLARKSLFLERGVLEISLSSRSFAEFKRKVTRLYESLSSPAWEKIWKE
jgi:hypothetical protein